MINFNSKCKVCGSDIVYNIYIARYRFFFDLKVDNISNDFKCASYNFNYSIYLEYIRRSIEYDLKNRIDLSLKVRCSKDPFCYGLNIDNGFYFDVNHKLIYLTKPIISSEYFRFKNKAYLLNFDLSFHLEKGSLTLYSLPTYKILLDISSNDKGFKFLTDLRKEKNLFKKMIRYSSFK